MASQVRSFIAVEITSGIRARAKKLIEQLGRTGADVKWVEPDNLHLTLAFLGEVPVLEIPEICDTAKASIGDFEPFEIDVSGVGAFPDLRRPRTIWLGVGDGADEMIALHDTLQQGLSKLGFRSENRRFRPHMTLGRVRHSPIGLDELGRAINDMKDLHIEAMEVAEVVVFSSRLDRGGPEYEPLGTIELKGRSWAS
jgi:2'-5' RNA ligase